VRIAATPFTEAVSRGLGLLSGVLVGSLVLVLIVIAANIANLVLARTIARGRELAVRAALGASRGRLVALIAGEVLIVGSIAAAIGLAASQATLGWVRQTMTDMPFWVDFTASPRTMAFVVGATLLASTIAGVLPALRATRRNLADALTAGARATTAGRGKASLAMIAIQVAVSIALLNGALVVAHGVSGYANPPLPVPGGSVLTARVWAERPLDADRIVRAAREIGGVTAAGAATSLPGLSPAAEMTEVETATPRPARPAPWVEVSRGFFDALGATPIAGRIFEPADFAPAAAPVAIVNEPFARKFFAGGNPVGARLRRVGTDAEAPEPPWREIVGVVPDLGLSAGDPEMAAGCYVPMPAREAFHVALRTTGDARARTGPLRDAIARLDATIQVRDARLLHDVGREDRAIFAGISAALAALGGMALLLSVVGTYAILSLSVARRTREIGIRAALGASRTRILTTIVGGVAVAPALGAAAGVLLGHALVAARGIFAFRLPDSAGPWGLPALATALIASGLLAAWVPARRALKVAPAEALRSDF
jgi:predicted permease